MHAGNNERAACLTARYVVLHSRRRPFSAPISPRCVFCIAGNFVISQNLPANVRLCNTMQNFHRRISGICACDRPVALPGYEYA